MIVINHHLNEISMPENVYGYFNGSGDGSGDGYGSGDGSGLGDGDG